MLLASLSVPMRQQLSTQGCAPGQGDPRCCTPALPPPAPWLLPAQTVTTGLFPGCQAGKQAAQSRCGVPLSGDIQTHLDVTLCDLLW